MTTEERVELLERKVAKLETQAEELSDLLADHGYPQEVDGD